jgi:hypothetical protein
MRAPDVIEASPAGHVKGQRAPSRVGKKGLTFYLEPPTMKKLRLIALDEETSLQALMTEAVNLLFKNRGQ